MIKHYFLIALRSLIRQKGFAFINMAGLAVGLAAFMLIFRYISEEMQYDNFHAEGDRIVRVQFERIYPDRLDQSAALTAGAGPMLYQEYPEIEDFTKVMRTDHMTNVFTVGDQSFMEEKLFYADSSFFRIFSFPLLAGNPQDVLKEVNSVVLSESAAMRYFGTTDVVGRNLEMSNETSAGTCKVTGVFADLPRNTHFDFDVLLSFQTVIEATDGAAGTSFNWNFFPTYLLLSPDADRNALTAKFPDFVDRHYQGMIERGTFPSLKLQPLKDIYLHSDLRLEIGPLGNWMVVKILAGVSFFIIILAYFNYINLTTAKSLQRAKEVGVRKVIGANRRQLRRQFMLEALLLNIMALILGFTLMQIAVPGIEKVLGKPLEGKVLDQPSLIFGMIVIVLFGTLLSGIYPAWVLSQMKVTSVLKGKKHQTGRASDIRKGLVVLQFAILCFMLVGSLVVRNQVAFMLQADRGFDPERLMVVTGPAQGSYTEERSSTFKTTVRANPRVKEVSNTTMIPGREIPWRNNNVRLETMHENQQTSMAFLGIDETYLDNLGLKLVTGRNFSAEILSDTASVLVSRAAVKMMGIANPEDVINRKLIDSNREFRVIGVVEDYLQESFKTGFDKIVYRYFPTSYDYYLVRMQSDDYRTSLMQVEEAFKNVFVNAPFEYFFLDSFFNEQFSEDRYFGVAFNFFTLLGTSIAILGLIGLTIFEVEYRRKEIGIRKVLGASSLKVLLLVTGKFGKLVVLAVVLALPIAYFAAERWLENYVFAAKIGVELLLIPVLTMLLLTLLATSAMSYRAANRNPVDTLRYE